MPATATIRMYNQLNLGDCFLLSFKDGASESFMLIDFGSYTSGNETREIEIANSIKSIVKDNPITVVLTHQHKDHLSGFISAEAIMKTLKITNLWFSFLDDPKSPEGIALRSATESFWKTNEKNTKLADKKFKDPTVKKMLNAKKKMDLFAETQTGGDAITNLLTWSTKKPKFLVPGNVFDLPGLPKDSVKVYVLGPPTDDKLLRKLDPGEGEAVNGLNVALQMMNLETSNNLMSDSLHTISGSIDKLTRERADNFPFNKKFTDQKNNTPIKNKYKSPQNKWRRIDYEWLSEMGNVSLHMNKLTNNSSLVLAFELVSSGKVLLFVADAQIGNWNSWFNVKFKDTTVNTRDLLMRTVLYKAGHHSSHNATLLESLDMMNEDELVIMIPINGEVSKKMGFSMLKPGMLKGYNRKSIGRVLRADTIYHKPTAPNSYKFPFAKAKNNFTPAIKVVDDGAKKSHLYIEYTVG